MAKLRVAVLCGGYSGESVVSMKTTAMVMNHIDRDKYEPVKVEISRTAWEAIDDEENRFPIDRNDFSFAIDNKKYEFDVALIMIHGSPGEDGILQGYFETIGLPYTTGGVLNTSLTFNKAATTRILSTFGYSVANSILVRKPGDMSPEKIASILSFPLFVKPNEGGSSLGVSKVKEPEGLAEALDKASEAGESILVEEFIPGREVTCGVVQRNGKPMALEITEIASKREFFDYDAKYKLDQTEEITPAKLPVEHYEKCQRMSEAIYAKLNCRGIVRVDYMFTQEEEFYVIEVNTVPGMTETSIVPQEAEAMGFSKTDLIDMIIDSVL